MYFHFCLCLYLYCICYCTNIITILWSHRTAQPQLYFPATLHWTLQKHYEADIWWWWWWWLYSHVFCICMLNDKRKISTIIVMMRKMIGHCGNIIRLIFARNTPSAIAHALHLPWWGISNAMQLNGIQCNKMYYINQLHYNKMHYITSAPEGGIFIAVRMQAAGQERPEENVGQSIV